MPQVLLDACQAGAELDVCLVALTRTVAVRLYSETELAYEVGDPQEPHPGNAGAPGNGAPGRASLAWAACCKR